MNQKIVRSCIEFLKSRGINHIVYCSGARNAPLIQGIEAEGDFTIENFFDERSASFYSLGLWKRGLRNAVLTTSGTAASELLSATIEAKYSGTPLLLITADRPKSSRGFALPQVIDQISFFKDYVDHQLDCDSNSSLTSLKWNNKGVCHLNICFEEPLWMKDYEIVGKIETIDTEVERNVFKISHIEFSNSIFLFSHMNEEERNRAQKFLDSNTCIYFSELGSGIQSSKSSLKLDVNEVFLDRFLNHNSIQKIVRVGKIPVSKFWRNLDSLEGLYEVINISDCKFSGLSWVKNSSTLTMDSLDKIKCSMTPVDKFVVDEFCLSANKIKMNLLQKYPNSEPSLVGSLMDKSKEADFLYVGNSMPVRDLDLAAPGETRRLGSNRGANGIDGQWATALGMIKENEHSLIILGDQTTLYDMNAGWILKYKKKHTINLVVINNLGCGIFRSFFPSEVFENKHDMGFQKLAELWGMKYFNFEDIDNLPNSGHNLIEINPSNEETSRFRKQWSELR
ncbi:MAG: thiamine pyrophosphate-binding protein [Bdellovibrionales bacterium]